MAIQAPTRLGMTRLTGSKPDRPPAGAAEDTGKQARHKRGMEHEGHNKVAVDPEQDAVDKYTRQEFPQVATFEVNPNTINISYGYSELNYCPLMHKTSANNTTSNKKTPTPNLHEHLLLATLKMVGWILWIVLGFPARYLYRSLIGLVGIFQYRLHAVRQDSKQAES